MEHVNTATWTRKDLVDALAASENTIARLCTELEQANEQLATLAGAVELSLAELRNIDNANMCDFEYDYKEYKLWATNRARFTAAKIEAILAATTKKEG